MIRVYHYSKCDTCRRALKFLEKRGIRAELVPIVEQPPTEKDLKLMLSHLGGELRRLFNTSGELYREMNLKEKLPKMGEEEAIRLLAKNGKLIKRPFLLTDRGGAVGFDEAEWKKLLS